MGLLLDKNCAITLIAGNAPLSLRALLSSLRIPYPLCAFGKSSTLYEVEYDTRGHITMLKALEDLVNR